MDGKRVLEEFKAAALGPVTIGIGPTESRRHRLVEYPAVDRIAGLKMRKEEADSLAISLGGRVEEITAS